MSKPRPKISIVTPSYNQADFLEETLRSVLEQGYPAIQYGVVDGGSDDGSVDIIERFRDRLDFAIIEPDDGQADAINKGFARCDGEILAYLNSDDTLLPGALNRVTTWFDEHPECDAVVGVCVGIDEQGRRLETMTPSPPQSLLAALTRAERVSMPQPAIFWRRRPWLEAGAFRTDLHYCFDFELWLRFLAIGVRFDSLDAEIATYRFHGQSKTCSTPERFHEEHDRVERAMLRQLRLADRYHAWRAIDYRLRLRALRRAPGSLWPAVARRPWWLASRDVRGALFHPSASVARRAA